MEKTKININNYILDKPLTSNNSGFSKWGIGLRGDSQFFVKEFLSPVYPVDDKIFTEQKKLDRINLCQSFVDEKCKLYSAIREASDGHINYMEQFFRVGAKYYITTKAITEHKLSIKEINDYPFIDRLCLCVSVSHAMARLHEKKIVHADIKPDNILVIYKHTLCPNIIDFDCSFFEYDCPKPGEELYGDMVYLSPEGYLHIAGYESNLSCKMDVFALGLLFSQYLSGSLPSFDQDEFQYPFESVLEDIPLVINPIENTECLNVLEWMLNKDPNERPDMQFVFEELNRIYLSMMNRKVPQKITPENDETYEFFERAGDL